MHYFLTGATGFIGRALTRRLLREGHRVTAWVRDETRARELLGPKVRLLATGAEDAALTSHLEEAEVVVNLAGDPLFVGRWNAAKKEDMVTSRVGLTERLVKAMEACREPPSALVSASAIGIYGDRGDEELSEDSSPAEGYLADLCRDWEAAARRATSLGVRVACVRIGVVLGLGGGALESMLPPFRLGLGGPLGSGRQYLSWIHIQDLVELFLTIARDTRYRGVFNGTAPTPERNGDFSRTLGRALNRPAFLPAPAFAVRLLIGEAAQVLLGGQRVLPRNALDLGFRFRYPELDGALGDILSPRTSGLVEEVAA